MGRFLALLGGAALLVSAPPLFFSASSLQPVPFQLIDNRIFVEVRVNGEGPFHFILDTGAGTSVGLDVADKLKLPHEETIEESGVGVATVRGFSSHIQSLSIGPATLENLAVEVLPFSDSSAVFGKAPLDGIIGAPIFEKYVVVHDYAARTLRFVVPGEFKYEGLGTILPFERIGYVPLVAGKVDGIPTKFGIDTGARSALLLYGPFVAARGLRDKYKPQFSGITGWGIGGPVRSDIVRIGNISVGPFSFDKVVARFSLNRSGATTDTSKAGLIGPDILKQFTVICDYSRHRLILEKNSDFGVHDTFDKAGAWLIQASHAFEVLDVIGGGSAEKAGLKVGDKILAIGDTSVDALLLPEVRDYWKYAPSGTKIRLQVQSGPAVTNVVLVLREMV